VITLIALIISPVNADGQPYSGIYLDRTPRSTSKFIFSTHFDITNPANMETSLLSVMTSAGGSGSGSSGGNGWFYQNVIACRNNGDIGYAPQAWSYENGNEFIDLLIDEDFDQNYEWYFGRTELNVNDECTEFYWYAYETEYDIEHDIYTYDEYTGSDGTSAHPDDFNFVVGDRTDTYHYRYMQVGVESTEEINGTNWKLTQGHIGYYYSSNWIYDPARSTTGIASVTVCEDGDSGTAIMVGGEIYRGVDKDASGNDWVRWENNQATRISDNVSVWTGSGSVGQTVSAPFS
jgi:hypothetical protein